MAIKSRSILNGSCKPDTSGSVFQANLDSLGSNDVWDFLVWAFVDTATRIGLAGQFEIPEDFVSGGKIVLIWSTTAITGNAVWDFDYRAVGGDDVESLDQVGVQESVTVTDGAPAAGMRKLKPEMALTNANLAAEDTVEFELFRDGTAADTINATIFLVDARFEYSDT